MKPYTASTDDTMRPRADHQSGDMVNRKPVPFAFFNRKPKKHHGRQAAGNRMGRQFAERLKQKEQ